MAHFLSAGLANLRRRGSIKEKVKGLASRRSAIRPAMILFVLLLCFVVAVFVIAIFIVLDPFKPPRFSFKDKHVLVSQSLKLPTQALRW